MDKPMSKDVLDADGLDVIEALVADAAAVEGVANVHEGSSYYAERVIRRAVEQGTLSIIGPDNHPFRASPPVSTDGLVEELREPQKWCCIFQHEGQMRHGTSGAPLRAADRIEQLTATLADRDATIERQREALRAAIAALGRVNVRCFDRPESPLKPVGDIARSGLASIAETLGDEVYDGLARKALESQP